MFAAFIGKVRVNDVPCWNPVIGQTFAVADHPDKYIWHCVLGLKIEEYFFETFPSYRYMKAFLQRNLRLHKDVSACSSRCTQCAGGLLLSVLWSKPLNFATSYWFGPKTVTMIGLCNSVSTYYLYSDWRYVNQKHLARPFFLQVCPYILLSRISADECEWKC